MDIPDGKDILVTVNKNSVAYNDNGGNGIPLIFIHAFPLDKSIWEQQEKELQSNRIISFDLRGFGQSAPGSEEISIELFADDLLGLMNILEINKAIACGISMGGYILLNAVQRHPERFEKIILVDTQCNADSQEAKEKRFASIDKLQSEGIEVFADDFISKALYNNDEKLLVKLRKTIVSTPVENISNTIKALAYRWDTCDMLKTVNTPALIIHGSEDKIIPLNKAVFLQKQLQHSVLKIINESGHFPNLEKPQEFNSAIRAFLDN